MWVLSAGLLPFWGMAAELCVPAAEFPDSSARAAIRWLGTAAMLGMMAVTLLPSNHYPFLHGFLVMVAGPMGVLAAFITVAKGRATTRVPGLASLLGTVALLLAIVNLAQYAREFWLEAEASPLLPGIQKLATLFFLAWVLSLSAVVLSGRRGRAR